MSMTPEMMEKAERAIHKKKLQDITKRLSLERRNHCIEDVPFFGLPFRVLFSLKQPESQIPLSKFYPFRAASAETEEKILEAIRMEREQGGEILDERLNEIRTSIESRDYTPADRREFYFSCFLSGWDFSTFKNWDWTGNRITESEADRLRAYYTERQNRYKDHPEWFAPPMLKIADDLNRYSQKTQEILKEFDNLNV